MTVTSQQLEATCERYVSLIGDADVDSMMSLFAQDCTVEDPVGSDRLSGQEQVRAFYATLPETGATATLTGPICAVPDARTAAFPFEIDTGGFTMSVTDVMTFDDDGKITSMTAYWKM